MTTNDCEDRGMSECEKCGQPIEWDTDRWVSSVSGDDGGTYDICEAGGGHRPEPKIARDEVEYPAWMEAGQ